MHFIAGYAPKVVAPVAPVSTVVSHGYGAPALGMPHLLKNSLYAQDSCSNWMNIPGLDYFISFGCFFIFRIFQTNSTSGNAFHCVFCFFAFFAFQSLILLSFLIAGYNKVVAAAPAYGGYSAYGGYGHGLGSCRIHLIKIRICLLR